MTTTKPDRPVLDENLGTILSSGTRPPRPSPVSAVRTFAWRALLKIKNNPFQLFDAVMLPILLTLIFTFLFGGALAGSADNYIQTLLPGILVMTVLLQTVTTGYTLGADVTKGIYDRIRSMSVWRPAALVGPLVADAVRYTLASVVVVVLGLILGFSPAGGVSGVVLGVIVLLAFAFSLSWIWTALAFVLKTPDSLLNIAMLLLQPLAFLSNIFVDPATMPGWLRAFVDINPVTHVVTAVRGLMHGTVTGAQIGWLLLACAILLLIFAPLTMRVQNKNNK
jgi:ABC-2 type transport system permease protein